MKAVIALSWLLLLVIVSCKEGADGGLPPFSSGIYAQVTGEKNKKFTSKFKEANKKLFNNQNLKRILQRGSPFREGMPTNDLGAAYQQSDGAGKDFLLKKELATTTENFCSMTPARKTQRLIEVSVDIQNSLRLLEVAMRMEDYTKIMKHADALNNVPLDVAKQVMTDLMTNPESAYYNHDIAETIKLNGANGRDPEAAKRAWELELDGGNKPFDSLTTERKKAIEKYIEDKKKKGEQVPSNKNEWVADYYKHQIELIKLGTVNGHLTGFNVMIGGKLVLPKGAKAPLEKIAEKYRRLLVLRSVVNQKYTEESVKEVRYSAEVLKQAEAAYNDQQLNKEVKAALKDLSKVFPKSNFLKKQDQPFLKNLEINKSQIGLGRPFERDERLDIAERVKVAKKEPTARAKNARKSNEAKAALEQINALSILGEETQSLSGDLADIDSLEQIMSRLLAESANFTTIESARMFVSNANIDDLQVAISGAFEDSGWPTTAQTGKVAVYGLFDSLMKEVGGVGNKALVGTAEDIFEALRKGINENRYNLGDKTRDIKAAYAFFEDINDVKNFQTEATFDFYRGKIFEAENKLRLTDSFITAFSPLREWKSIMCPAIGEKLDCNISDMYAAVVTNIEQGQDLTDQIRFLFGMPKNSSLKDRYIGLLKALKDLVEMTKDMNKTCGVGEVLDAIKTEGLTDTYIYTQVKQQEFWQVNLMYEDELKKILQENSERQANPKIDSGLNYKKEKEIGKAVTK